MSEGHVLAIDIGASKTLVTLRGRHAEPDTWRRDAVVARRVTDRDPAALVGWIVAEARAMGGEWSGPLEAVGVAAPGPVDAAAGVVTRSSNLGWQDVPLAAMLAERLGAPAALEDDANTAALGEWRFGAGQLADPFAYLTLSSGVGGAVLVAGQIVRGAHGNAGEVGHIVVDPAGPRCACGRRGDVEAFAGGAALARRARRAWPRRGLEGGRQAPRAASEIYRAAREGDSTARSIVDEAVVAVATALAAFASVIEPELIAVGGSVALRQWPIVRRAGALARRSVMAENGRSLDIRRAELGEDSVLAGATVLAWRLAEGRSRA